MKRAFIILSALLVIPFWLASKDAFFIYRNDQEFNVFFFENVDSIKYSHNDEDNIARHNFVCQEIFTPDSTYRIPLAAIDSVGFVTPETKFKQDVKSLSAMMPYIKSHDGLTFTIANDCPESMTLKIGDKVATVDYNALFPTGFAAQVSNISKRSDQTTLIECETVDLAEIFDCFYGLSSDLPDSNRQAKTKSVSPRAIDEIFDKVFDLGEHNLLHLTNFPGLTYENSLSIQNPSELTLSIHPILKALGYVIVTPELGTQIGGTVVGTFNLKEELSFSGSISWSESISHAIELPIMAVAPLVDISLYLEPGTFIRTSAIGGLQIEAAQQYISSFNFQFNSKLGDNPLKTVLPNVRQSGSSFDGSIYLHGDVDLGAFLDFGVNVIHPNFTKIALHNELGLRFSGNRTIFKSDFSSDNTTNTALYKQLSETKYNLGWFTESSITAAIWPYQADFPLPIKSYHPIAEVAHVPVFSNGTCVYSSGVLTTSMDINGEVFRPVDIGFVFLDESHNEVGRVWTDLKYDNTIHKVTYRSSIPDGSKAKYVVPMVSALSTTMLALPTFEVKQENFTLSGKWKPISSSDGSVDSAYYLTFYRDGSYLGTDPEDGEIYEEGSYIYDGTTLSLYCDGNDDTQYQISFPSDNTMLLTYIPTEEGEETFFTVYQKIVAESLVGIWEPFSANEGLQDYYKMIMYPDNTYEGVSCSSGKVEKWGSYSYGGGYLNLVYTSDGNSWSKDAILIHLSPDGSRLYGRVGKDTWAIYQYAGTPPKK